MRSQIIRDCINNIKEFGYPDVNSENIFKDEIYSRFFRSILEQNLGENSFVDCAITDLLKEIDEKSKEQ